LKLKFLLFLLFVLLIPSITASEWISDNNNFNNGTYIRTFLNSTFVQLNTTFNNGSYISEIFNATNSTWNNISWIDNGIGEMPSNGTIEPNGINMTGNVLLYHLDELTSGSAPGGADFTDESGNGNHGNETNGVTFGNNGQIKQASGFDGTSTYITTNNNIGIGDGIRRSVSLWFNTSSTSIQNFIGWGSGSHGEFAIQTQSGGSDIRVGINGAYRIFTLPNYNDGKMHHIVVILNGSKTSDLYAWIDGSSSAPVSTLDQPLNTVDTQAVIGKNPNSASQYHNGLIDEIAVFNRSLSENEIINLYKRGKRRLNISVRSCNDAVCSGESWTNLGEVNSPQTLSVIDNEYFQYNISFKSENETIIPKLYNVTVDYTLGTSASCTYSGGNWTVNGADNCNLIDNVDLGGNFLIFNGPGSAIVTSILKNITKVKLYNGIVVNLNSGRKNNLQMN